MDGVALGASRVKLPLEPHRLGFNLLFLDVAERALKKHYYVELLGSYCEER